MPTRSTALFSVSKRSGASPDNFRSFFFKPNFRSSAFRSCFYKRISITNIWPYRFVCLPRLQLVDCLHCSNQAWRGKYCIGLCIVPFSETRSYAALRAADLDWIVGPGNRIDFFRIYFVSFKLFFYQIYYVLSNHNNFGRGRGGRAGISKNVTHAGSQLPR